MLPWFTKDLFIFLREGKHNFYKKKKSRMEDNLSELGGPSSKAKYETLSDSE